MNSSSLNLNFEEIYLVFWIILPVNFVPNSDHLTSAA